MKLETTVDFTPLTADSALNSNPTNEINRLIEDIDLSKDLVLKKLDTLERTSTTEKLEQYRESIATLKTDIDTFRNLNLIFTGGTSRDKKAAAALSLALNYTALAQISLDNKQTEKAWEAIARARHYIGFLEGFFAFLSLGPTPKNGGQKSAENRKRKKELMLHALTNIEPQRKFKDTDETAQWLWHVLNSTFQTEGILQGKKSSEIIKGFIKSISEDIEIYNAFSYRKTNRQPGK